MLDTFRANVAGTADHFNRQLHQTEIDPSKKTKYDIKAYNTPIRAVEGGIDGAYAVFGHGGKVEIKIDINMVKSIAEYKLASIIHHETIHARQFSDGINYADKIGNALNEVEAYDAQIQMVKELGSKPEDYDKSYVNRLMGDTYRGLYYNQLPSSYQDKVSKGIYRK